MRAPRRPSFDSSSYAMGAAGNCAFAPNSADRFAALAAELLVAPVEIIDPFTGETFLFTYQDLIGERIGRPLQPLRLPRPGRSARSLSRSPLPPPSSECSSMACRSRPDSHQSGPPDYPNFVESFPAIACEDSNNPTDYQVWFDQGVAADADLRLLRENLDLGVERLCPVALRGRRPVHGTFHRCYR